MTILFILLCVGFIVWMVKKEKKDGLPELEMMILAADREGSSGPLRERLREYEEQHHIDEKTHMKTRENMYRRMADEGELEGLFEMGHYAYIDEDYAKAEKLWLQAAEGGWLKAMHRLGMEYSDIGSLPTQNDKSFYWHYKAAQMGYVPAMRSVATCYFLGQGIEEDRDKAVKWLERGFASGDAKCGCDLAKEYASPISPYNNANKAIEVLKKVMMMGDADASESATDILNMICDN